MARTIFEEVGGTYTEINRYLIPNLTLPAEEKQHSIGVWGQRHKLYLRARKRATYTTLLTSGKLNGYLADIDKQAQNTFSRTVKQLAGKEGVTEKIKAENQMLWVQKTESILSMAKK